MFQSTLPCGERPFSWCFPRPLRNVSIHAPVRGATFSVWITIIPSDSFNPRSRAGSDRRAGRAGREMRGFNPRSRAGSDDAIVARFGVLMRFNPRSRAGSDLKPVYLVQLALVSIHAPVRGATCPGTLDNQASMFQSTLPCGERRMSAWPEQRGWARFNPRSRAGSDN